MKKLIFYILTTFVMTNLWGQTDSKGNPVFNSEVISEEKFETFELTSSYYNIKDNISDKNSSVYQNDNPTRKEYLKFAREYPSNYFIIHNGSAMTIGIIVLPQIKANETSYKYNIVNPNTGKKIEAQCNVWGEISEKRAEELIKLKIDTTATIIELPNNGKGLLYDGIVYRIQPYEKLKYEIIEIAKQIVNGGDEKQTTNLIEYIKKESIGGKLDFNKTLEEKKQTLFLYDGIAYSKNDFAIYLWGKKVKSLGINSVKNATQLWEEINNKILTQPEKKALIKGFKSK